MAVVGYTLLGILAAVLLLLCIPVRLEIRYKTGRVPAAVLRWIFLRFDLAKPEEPAARKPAKQKKSQKEKTEAAPAKRPPMEFAELLGMILDLLSSLKGNTGMLVRSFKLYKIRLSMVVAEGDAADTAITYGRVNAAVYGAYALAQSFLRLGRPEIEIRPDFTAEEGSVDFEVGGRLTPIAALGTAIRVGVAFLVKTIRRKKAKQAAEAPPRPAAPVKTNEHQAPAESEKEEQAVK